jgi:hypothetical protein
VSRRIAISLSLGLLAAHFTFTTYPGRTKPSDFAQIWMAARVLLHDGNPYSVIGPGGPFHFPFPLLYPLPAAVAVMPLAAWSERGAAVVFALLTGVAFAWVLTREGYGPLLGFFSASMAYALWSVQWSPLLASGTVLLPLSALYVAKPTIAAALFVARPSWWPIAGALVLGAVAFLLEPRWVTDWLGAVEANRQAWAPAVPYRAPVALPGGILALACLARWRRPEARLVAALACVPQTLFLYETVPLFLVPKKLWEAAVLVLGSYAAIWWASPRLPTTPNLPLSLEVYGRAIILAMYLPATALVLLRPNEGALPGWVERRLLFLPEWLRGVTH